MAEADVEVVRKVFDAVSRRDSSAIQRLYDPDVEIVFARGTLTDLLDGRLEWRGLAELREFDRELRDAFVDFETNCDELIDTGERVITVSRYRGRGRESGVEVEGRVQFGVWTIENHRVVRVEWFNTRADALEAAAAGADHM